MILMPANRYDINTKLDLSKQLANTDIKARWIHSDYDVQAKRYVHGVDSVDLGDSLVRITKSKLIKDSGLLIMEAGLMFVDPGLRGEGHGAKLLKSLGGLAYKYDCDQLRTKVTSQYALAIVGNFAGYSNIVFSSDNESYPEVTAIPTSLEEGIAILESLELLETDLDYRSLGFNLAINMHAINPSNFTMPIEDGEPMNAGHNRAIL
jgi:GNAT superfamily N-acetyltransferase